jgi:hypothetical protein
MILAASLLVGAPGVALADDDAPPNECIMVRTISSWTDVDERTAIIKISPRKEYRIRFWGPCPEMRHSALARLDRGPGRSMCLRRGDAIVFRDSLPVGGQDWVEQRCIIDSIERVPRDAIAP